MSQNFQGPQTQGKTEKLQQPKGAYRDMTFWMGSWNRKRTLGKTKKT